VINDLIGTDDHSLLSWKSVQDHLIDLINGIIFGGEDGALKEEGIRQLHASSPPDHNSTALEEGSCPPKPPIAAVKWAWGHSLKDTCQTL
jgi:hypothetical protein